MAISLSERVLELALAIQQIPAPTFLEGARAAFVRDRFQAEGLSDVHIDESGNVNARLPGKQGGRPVVVTAHLDTVFPLATPLEHRVEADRITAPGIGDNSLGVAGLFGLAWALTAVQESKLSRKARRFHSSLPGDVWLVANVGEEGLGDLRGIKAVVNRFHDQPIAYIVIEGMSLGWVYHRGLGVQRYRITVRTQGGHSWIDYGRPSAIHEIAQLINQLNAFTVPEKPRTTLNVGVIQGGTSVNTIAAEAHLELDLRSEQVEALNQLCSQVERLVAAVNRKDVEVSAQVIGQRPAGGIPPEHPLIELAMGCLEAQEITPRLNIGSTDANIPLSMGLPAICIGLTTGGGAHTTGEYILTQLLAQGLAQLVELVKEIFLKLGK